MNGKRIFVSADTEGYFSEVFKASPIALSISRDEDGKLTEVNDVWCSLMGYAREEGLGKNLAELGLIDEKERVRIREEFLTKGCLRLFESEIKSKSGSVKKILTSAEGITINGEKFSINFVIEITERIKLEKSILESEQKFRNIFEHSVVGKSVTYMDGKLQTNKAFREILGYSEEELSHMKWQEMTHPESVSNDQKQFDTMISGKKNEAHWEKRYIKKSGETIWVDISAVIQRDTEGKPLYFITTIIDITDRKEEIIRRKEAEEEVKKLNKTLEQRVIERTAQLEAAIDELSTTNQQLHAVNKELEAFSYSVSHDLRAPLRHINGFADILVKQYSDQMNEKAMAHLYTIINAAKKMGTLIDDLLSFSRTGRAELRKASFKMNQVIDDALNQIRPMYIDRKIDFNITALPVVYGDYNLLRQVWINLIDNAFKYTKTREQAIISIGFKSEPNDIIFFIKDNGVGFDMQYSQKLFGVFQRLHSSTDFDGTGIGLANVQRIILRHGGKAWAQAEPDKGAAFYFSIPKEKGDKK